MDYAALAATGDSLIKKVGLKMKLTRAGADVGTGFGVFVKKEAADETSSQSSLLAQTTQSTRSLLMSGLTKAPLVGDVVLADKETWTVKNVQTVRPTNVTLLFKLEVA